jgi:serine/threonine-protein phosphatase 6 regulatory ankyrin repeat subunit B
VVERLIAVGADVNIKGCYGITPLMVCKDPEIGALLLDNGADMSLTDKGDLTAVMHACKTGNTGMVSLLINRGVDVFPVLKNGDTTLILACEYGHGNVGKLLLQTEGATKEWVDHRSGYALFHVLVHDDVDCAAALISFGAYVHTDLWDHAISYLCSYDMLELLLNAGAHTPAEDGKALLATACNCGYSDLAKLMLDRKADVNAVDEHGITPLALAILSVSPPTRGLKQYGRLVPQEAYVDLVKTLLEYGADPRVADNNGCIPLMHAKYDFSVSPLIEAAPDTVNHRDNSGWTVLHYFSRRIVIHYSRVCSDRTLVQLLKHTQNGEYPIDINVADENGDTALHIAMMDLNSDAVKLLLENGAEVLGSGYEGTTVLMKPFVKAHGSLIEICIREKKKAFDKQIQSCLQDIIDNILLGKNDDVGVSSRGIGSGGGGGDGQPAAKRRRM